jgi:hypothetical protein
VGRFGIAFEDGHQARALTLLAAAALAIGFAPAAGAITTPGQTVWCAVDGKKLVCWRPRTGFTATMTATGKPTSGVVASNKGRRGSGRVVAFAHTWAQGAWTCTSRKTGLICLNRKNHGWWLGRNRGYRGL